MNISDSIELFINNLLNDASGEVMINRNDLAKYLGCVPSQINYVISKRFTVERGYIVESKRGISGYVRIARIEIGDDALIMHVINSVGSELDAQSARAILKNLAELSLVTEKEASLILTALSFVSKENGDRVRAEIFKSMLARLV